MRLTVVLCFFDEEELLPGLPDLLESVRASLSGHETSFLAVDDGSRDGTAAGLAAIPDLEVVTHAQNRGVGAAMTTGLERAGGDAAVVYDPDAAYAPESLAPLVAALDESDVATLSPYHPDGGVEGVGWLRRLLSRCASNLYRRRLSSPLHTFTCAVRAYRLPAAKRLLPAPDDFTAGAFLLARALKEGLRVAEVPAVLHARRKGKSKMAVLKTIAAHLRLLRRI